jgi:hypothetical protein
MPTCKRGRAAVQTYVYDDFSLKFTPIKPGVYDVVARPATGDEGRTTFTMPMNSDSLESAILALGRMRSRDVGATDQGAVQANAEQLGGQLATALFDSTLGPLFNDARDRAARDGRGVRLILSLASTPELLSVPWELLYIRPTFLASQRRTPVVRYLETGEPPPPSAIHGAVRVLGVVASPTGLPPLDVAGERRRVEHALAAMVAKGLIVLDWCDPATPRRLREQLRDGSYHVLHYIGHSNFTDHGDGILYLDAEDGQPAPVTEAVLTNLLGDQTSLRLAVLNSCEGARTTLTDPFAGIATSLVALGVPAVVAMQFTISDEAAVVFAEELFTSLIGRQYPIDAAVSEARKAVFTEVNEIEWATPVLFLRAADGQLFDFADAPAAEVPPPKLPPTPLLPPTPEPHDAMATRKRRRLAIAGAAAAAVAIAIAAVIALWPSGPSSRGSSTTVGTDGSASDVSSARAAVPSSDPTRVPAGTIEDGTHYGYLTDQGDGSFSFDRVDLADDGTWANVNSMIRTLPYTGQVDLANGAPVVVEVQDQHVVDVSSTSAFGNCNGATLPTRPESPELPSDQAASLAALQAWVDLVAAAPPHRENADLYGRIKQLYPDWGVDSAGELQEHYGNMEAAHMMWVRANEDDSFTAAELVYDNPVNGHPCRTGFLCQRVTMNDGVLAGISQDAPEATIGDYGSVSESYPYVDGTWIPADATASSSSTVQEQLVDLCGNGPA